VQALHVELDVVFGRLRAGAGGRGWRRALLVARRRDAAFVSALTNAWVLLIEILR
jgi:hypothetical protein